MKVELKNLTKIFPNRDKKKVNEDVVAVNNFTFEIPDGKLIGLLGPSGCGKSTTLYMISGLQKPSSGQIFFGDEDVTELPTEKRGVGLVFQNYALYPHMTVKQNILFPLQNLKGKDKMTKDEMLASAVHLEMYEINNASVENIAKAKMDYCNKILQVNGQITQITEEYIVISSGDYAIDVYLPLEELITLSSIQPR